MVLSCIGVESVLLPASCVNPQLCPILVALPFDNNCTRFGVDVEH
jgi:hypothetical protein